MANRRVNNPVISGEIDNYIGSFGVEPFVVVECTPASCHVCQYDT